MTTTKRPSDTIATMTTAETTPAKDPRPTEAPGRALVAREDIARAILAALTLRERREVYQCVRAFLRVLHGAHTVAAWHEDITAALDRGSATEAVDHAAEAAQALAVVLYASPLRPANSAVCSALLGVDPVAAAQEIGVFDGAEDAARCREALRALRRAYRSAEGST